MTALLDQVPQISIGKNLAVVFVGVLGLARENYLRVVLKQLNAEGVTSSDSRGDLYRKIVTRA